MDERSLAEPFEQNRAHLRAVAFRMLGSPSEAEDAVQEAWLRLSRSETSDVQNLGAWLTTVVARVCLDMLRSRKSRREEQLDAQLPEPVASSEDAAQPEASRLLADSIGVALLVVLETLAPAERVAFVLHDLFDLSFEDIAPIVGRSPGAARQLASRARRRVQGGASVADDDPDLTGKQAVVDAFLAASRNGDFSALIAVLSPGVVLRPDQAALAASATTRDKGAPNLADLDGAAAVAGAFCGRAKAARAALIDGSPGAVWAPGGVPRVVFVFSITGKQVVELEVLADPARIRELEIVLTG